MAEDTHSAGPAAAGPLAGRTVVVTRTREQAAQLVGPLEALGARVLAFPVIRTVEPDDWAPADRAIAQLDSYAWVVLTSTNAVDRFIDRLAHDGKGPEALAACRVAVVGRGTAGRLAEHGIEPDIVPEEFRGEGLIEAFRAAGAGPGWRILIPRALEAREILPDTLREMGAEVDVVPVYRTVRAEVDLGIVRALRAGEVDCVTFTSPSTFTSFVSLVEGVGVDIPGLMASTVTASIGPVTSQAMQMRGFEPTIEAEESTVPGLVAAIEAYYSAV